MVGPSHAVPGDIVDDRRSSAAASASDLVKIYGEGNTRVVALDDVSIGFELGEFIAIMGPSGSGKSTLLHCMAGLDTVTSGQVFVGNTDLSTLKERELTLLRRDNVGFVFQAYNLVPTLSAIENITLPIDLAGETPDAAWLDQVIGAVGLSDRVDHRPSELSGGQQQRVAVARALASKPDIIFADEPTGNLDSVSSQEVLGCLRRAVDEWQQTVVMVTHDASAAGIADRVVFLRDGQVVDQISEPTPERVLERLKALEG